MFCTDAFVSMSDDFTVSSATAARGMLGEKKKRGYWYRQILQEIVVSSHPYFAA